MLPGRRRCCRLRRGAAARVALREIRGDGGSVDGAEDGHAGQSPGARRCCRRSATATGGAALQPAVRRCSRPRGAAAGRAGLQPAVRCCSRTRGTAAGRAGLLQDAASDAPGNTIPRNRRATGRIHRLAGSSAARPAAGATVRGIGGAPGCRKMRQAPRNAGSVRRKDASVHSDDTSICSARGPYAFPADLQPRRFPGSRTRGPAAGRAVRVTGRAPVGDRSRAVPRMTGRGPLSGGPQDDRSGTALGRSPG